MASREIALDNVAEHPGYGKRHVICAILFFAYISTYFCRSIISVAIVGMTTDDSSNSNFPMYDWSNSEQNVIISSFYGGLVVTSIFAGEFIRLLGPHSILYISFLGQALLSVITELCTSTGGWKLFAVNRVLIGFCTGFVDPLFFYVSSKWFPLNERDSLLNFMFCGAALGTALASQVGGALAEGPTGWPSIFYLSGVLLVIFCIMWKFLGYWSPQECKGIRSEELTYIEKSLAAATAPAAGKIPWKDISKSVPVYALLTMEIAQGVILALLVTQTALFIDSVQHISVTMNGLLSSLPIYTQFIWQGIIGKVSDILVDKNILTTVKIRKIASILAVSVNAASIVIIGIVGNSLIATVALLFVCFFCLSFSYVGYMTNSLDLSQNYSQNIVGVCRAVENISSFATPLVVSALLNGDKSLDSWRLAFGVVAIPCFICNVFYVIFGKAERQPWDMIEGRKTPIDP